MVSGFVLSNMLLAAVLKNEVFFLPPSHRHLRVSSVVQEGWGAELLDLSCQPDQKKKNSLRLAISLLARWFGVARVIREGRDDERFDSFLVLQSAQFHAYFLLCLADSLASSIPAPVISCRDSIVSACGLGVCQYVIDFSINRNILVFCWRC